MTTEEAKETAAQELLDGLNAAQALDDAAAAGARATQAQRDYDDLIMRHAQGMVDMTEAEDEFYAA